MRRSSLFIPGIIFVLNFIVLIFILVVQPTQETASSQDGPEMEAGAEETVYIVIQSSPDEYQTHEISIHSPVSGFEALELTGVDLDIKDFGDGTFAVCSIAGVGCSANDCFCQKDVFWNYQYWDGEAWQSYQVGAADSIIDGGAIEGWRWGEFESDGLPPVSEIIPNE